MKELTKLIIPWLDSARDPQTGLELLRISGHPSYLKLEPFRHTSSLPIPRREELRKALIEVLHINGIEYQLPTPPAPDPETELLRNLRAQKDRLVFLQDGHKNELKNAEGGVLHPGMYDRRARLQQAINQLEAQIQILDQQIDQEQKKKDDAPTGEDPGAPAGSSYYPTWEGVRYLPAGNERGGAGGRPGTQGKGEGIT